jgi:predicted amidohydrolase YtcJ
MNGSWRHFYRMLNPALLGVSVFGCAIGVSQAANAHSATSKANLYFNGQILTMEGDDPRYVEVIVERNGLIAFAGGLKQALKTFPDAKRHNLQGQTLLPGFIDSHGHLYLTGLLLSMANVLPDPDGTATDFNALVTITKDWMVSPRGKTFTKTFGWVLANGYDHTTLREGAHPTSEVLDQITTEHPVLMLHQSGHVAVLNSKALELLGFTKDTPDPAGGVIRRRPDGMPNGVIEESVVTQIANPILSRVNAEIDAMAIKRGQELYTRFGYTTAEEARAYPSVSAALERAAMNQAFRIDVIGYPDIVANRKGMDSPFWNADRSYTHRYRIGGAKISLDGSPQSKTAWLTHPYHIVPDHTAPDYRGYPAMPDEKALGYFKLAASHRWPIICHANGDAAIDQCLTSIDEAQKQYPNPEHRSVVVHAQMMRADQVTRMKAIGALPTFFAAHTFYWGDYHRESTLGSPRAERISPTRDAIKAGLTLTTHHDSPVIMPNAMRIVDATVNRTTRSGKVLGPEQRLTPYEALKAITIWGAIQHFEEASKGTLTKGKRADFVILSDNPVKSAPAKIKTIHVTATIKDGQRIHCAPDPARTAICK